jgi:hypothetical protein
MTAVSRRPTVAPSRQAFQARLRAICGDVRVLWMPKDADAATAVTDETVPGRTITWDATVAGRLSRLGPSGAYGQAFVSASSQWGTSPDTADLSFGNGTVDSPFSIVVLANVTDTAAIRAVVGKFDASNREYLLRVNADDTLSLVLEDESAVSQAIRTSTVAITQGSWHLFGATYDPSLGSGALAANGITLYQDGAVIASTASNSGTYVAMENLAAPLEISGQAAHTTNFLDGSLALVAVVGRALSAADQAALAVLCRRYAGVPA